MRTYGTAGQSASLLQRRRNRWHRVIGWTAAGVGLVAVGVGRPATLFVVVVAAYLIRYRLRAMEYAARAGATAEAEVAMLLESYRPEVLIFDLDLRGRRSDIDAIVLGPIVATVEVKSARGRAVPMSDGTVRVGGDWLAGRPLAQAASHAVAVGGFTDHHVEAVLCITGMRQRPHIVEYGNTQVWVTNGRRLRRTLKKLPRILDAREARKLGKRLRTGSNASQRPFGPVH